jgi:CRP/FNR family cyclic AMP-dependent transcriptional regulator
MNVRDPPSRAMLTDTDPQDLIAALPDPGLRELAAHGAVRSYRKDVVIIQEGDLGDSLYLILAGRVKVFASSEDAREVVLDTHAAGEYVGEWSLDGGPRSASVITLEPTVCSVITRATLQEHIARRPEFAFDLLAKVISRARRATQNVKSLALLGVYGRLARLLDELAVVEDGERVVPERLTHQEIAERIGSSREMVSRLLTDLTKGGYVAIVDKRFVLRKPLPAAW